MQELVKNGKVEEYWKEATVELPAGEEFTYVVQNKNTNCVLIRNNSNAIITAGAKSCSHEVSLANGNNGVVSRPFPLRYVYLRADKPCAVNIIETVSQDPVSNIVQQEVVHKINVISGVNLDINKNVGVVVHNERLKVCQLEALKPLSVNGSNIITLDTGIYGRQIVNVYAWTSAVSATFVVDVSNDNIDWFSRTSFSTPTNGGGTFISFNDNAFRYIRVITNTNHSNSIVISAIR
jgi:hypothetical protein